MNIMLGNLTVDEIEKRIGVDFPHDIKNFMIASRVENTSEIKKGNWHCFDLPFCILCGDIETATKIYNSVKHRASEVKEQLQISVQKE